MKEAHGYYNGHYWGWSQDYGFYICTDFPTQLCADTMEDLHRMMREQIDCILRERNISLEQYINERTVYHQAFDELHPN